MTRAVRPVILINSPVWLSKFPRSSAYFSCYPQEQESDFEILKYLNH